ncbi:MAG: 2'-deoxycytidine 5'-triphosphate deaminase [bacterium]
MKHEISYKRGALPSQLILELINAGYISGTDINNVKPGSLDLTLSDEVYKVEGIFQPKPSETVRQVLEKIKKQKHSLEQPLLKDQMYVIRVNEKISLPKSVYAYCNPKSSSGRVDVHVRLLADGVSRYDAVSSGFEGELWVSIVPKTFNVKMSVGQSYNQIRFFTSDTRFNDLELEVAMKQHKLLWSSNSNKTYLFDDLTISDKDGSIIQTLDLSGDIIGYVGRKTDKIIDLGKVGHYKASDFFKPIKKNGDFIYLKKGEFYILSTLEAVRVPPDLACEMVSMDERSGEFRSHYAGFIDPGWGWGSNGEGKGRQLTLEVRPFEDIIVRHNQPIAKIKFERMIDIPHSLYDAIGSNYTIQSGPKLGKHFK